MRTALASALLLSGLAAATGAAHAQKLAPGLWEHSVTMNTRTGRMEAAMAQMQKQLAAMPPAQRKQAEAIMAQQGMSMGGPGKPSTLRFCLTPEQAANDQIPQEKDCKQQSLQRSGNVITFKFACAGNPPSRGEGEYTLLSDKAHKGRVTIDTVADGKPERLQMEQSARWLGADCGTVKPRP